VRERPQRVKRIIVMGRTGKFEKAKNGYMKLFVKILGISEKFSKFNMGRRFISEFM
jgi:hypothetical protein